MIAIACATTDERAFRAGAAPTIEALDDGSSLLLRRHGSESIDVPYNAMLEVAASREDLEAIVFIHQDTAVDREAGALAQIRSLLAASPDIAVVGAVDDGRPRELGAADGTLVGLSPWAARHLRFDGRLGGSVDASVHDLSLRARLAGRHVVGAPLGVVRGSVAPVAPDDRRRRLRAMVDLGRMWAGQGPLLEASGADC